MTLHSGAYELLARSHHYSGHSSHYDSSDVSFDGAWWMIPVAAVIAAVWVFAKRRFRSR
ncbi:hypothetical protein [Streptomyces sp. NPDC058773]|uniref:hypothetical protein n=1 Tax=Streptomyces sp. NPDC058773 TaxID=3346632 RepID=UPI0036A72920